MISVMLKTMHVPTIRRVFYYFVLVICFIRVFAWVTMLFITRCIHTEAILGLLHELVNHVNQIYINQGCSTMYCGPNILFNIILFIVRQKNIVLLFIGKKIYNILAIQY